MAQRLWARWDERIDGTCALTLFRRVVVDTARGEALEDVPVLVVEDVEGRIKEAPEAVELEIDSKRSDGGVIEIFARATATGQVPVDPKPKLKKFDDPESERRQEARKRRGMGRFLGKEEKSKPVSKGAAPPVPPEQRVGGKGRIVGRRKKGAGSKKVKRGGGVRGAARSSTQGKGGQQQ